MTSKPNPSTHIHALARDASVLPPAWINARDAHAQLWSRLAAGVPSLLICDYDGTLAPFKADKMLATPFPGVAERLTTIAALPGCTLALVSGRPVAELLTLFPLAAELEVYGSHGREYRSATGTYRLQEVTSAVQGSLDTAAAQLAAQGYGDALERKSGSLAVHWRNLSPADQATLAARAQEVFAAHTDGDTLAVLPFESGIELRAGDQTKAHAVEALLAASPPTAPIAAYLGDDLTDEDAFGALGDKGVSLLVRDEPRPSLAHYWLRPPAQLIGFLDDWARAAGRSRPRDSQ